VYSLFVEPTAGLEPATYCLRNIFASVRIGESFIFYKVNACTEMHQNAPSRLQLGYRKRPAASGVH
jgi:hypothetical protein